MNPLSHAFNVELATKYGIDEAILIAHFQYWINLNHRTNKNKIEGRTWTFQTRKDIAAHFPYWDENKVKRLVARLLKLKVILIGNFNKKSFDKTNWYAFVDQKMFTMDENDQSMDENVHGVDENDQPIPDTKPNTKTKNNTTCYSSVRKNSNTSITNQITFSKDTFSFEGIRQEDREAWMQAYPNVDIAVQLFRMTEWIKANPKKANKKNWRKFITNWLLASSEKAESREAYSIAKTNDSQDNPEAWARKNAKTFYEWKEKSNGALNHCYIKNGYLINKENSREARINIKPDAFEILMCQIAGVRRS
jgi:hypothetical protein